MNGYQFEILAEKYGDMVFRLAYSATKDRADSEDVTQNVLLKLYKSEKEFENEEHVKNWLVRVTINECKKIWRSPWKKTDSIEDYPFPAPSDNQLYNEVYDSIMRLDSGSRTIIVLYYIEGYSAKEISHILKLPANTVYTRLKRARDKLRRSMTEEVDSDD